MKGSYCLVINLKEDTKIKIGKVLGEINFHEGTYIYVGSAMNSLEARVKRHLSDNKKKHWHVDYFLLNKNTNVENVIVNISDEKIECLLAGEIQNGEKTIEKFGCSDCDCESHMIYFKDYETACEKIKNAFKKLGLKYMELNEFNRFL